MNERTDLVTMKGQPLTLLGEAVKVGGKAPDFEVVAKFGNAFGVLIKELRLLARAVFVIDKEGTIQYKEIVGEQFGPELTAEGLTNEPDYDAALKAARQLL